MRRRRVVVIRGSLAPGVEPPSGALLGPIDELLKAEMAEALGDRLWSERVRCAVCGVRGRWVGGSVVNAEPHDVPSLCSTRPARPRAHGPWVPDV